MRNKEIENQKRRLRLRKKQKEILVGLLLGDACLETQNQGRTWRLKIEHSLKQKEYVDWLYEVFKGFVRTPPKVIKKKIGRKEYLNYGFSTLSVGNLRFFGFQFYGKERKKRIPRIIKKLLTPLALAVWFMNDGSRKSNRHKTYVLHSLGFEKEDLKVLQEAFKEKFGIETHCHIQKKYRKPRWRLYIASKSSRKFRDLIEPHILPMFKYKLV
jgi:hypothetical protein